MCVVRSRSCRWRETAAGGNATRGEKRERKKMREPRGEESRPWRTSAARGNERARVRERESERDRATERQRKKRKERAESRARQRGSGIQVHRGPIIRAGRPITYWFFTYDLIHYHSVIYICPTCCGFRGFAPRTRETRGKMQPRRDATQ